MMNTIQSSLRVCEAFQPDKYNMPKRKVWTEEEDKILKFLRQERKVHKWENIARIMQQEFSIAGRSGKQCRERYHNHLDSAIVTTEWLPEEEEILLAEHEEIGNKWSAISQKLPGRSDNCVKNHFYSKLRKSIRRLNKIIQEELGKEHNQIKLRTLYKIIEVQQTKFQINSKVDEELADFCKNIKNRLFVLEEGEDEREEGASEQAHRLIADIHWFENNQKKGYRAAIKRKEHGKDEKSYLKPPSSGIKRSSSISSDRSDDSNSYLSSASYVSSISDLSEFQDNKKSKTTRSRRGSSAISSQNKEQNNQCQNRESDPMEMAPQDFIRGHGELIEEDEMQDMNGGNFANELFNGMMYEDTPVMARIFSPSLHFDDADFQIFPREMEIDDEPIELQEPSQNH